MSAPRTALSLPSISEVDEADNRIGVFKSDLDSIRSQAATFAGFTPLDEAHALAQAGIDVKEQRRDVDPAVIARLLVFADEVIDDADHIRTDARALRQYLLTAYREFVIEGDSWRDHEEASVDA